MHIMKTTPFILTVMLTVVCCTKTAAQGFQRESFPEGSYSPVTNINRGSYPRVLADNRVMFRVNAPQAQQVQIDLCGTTGRCIMCNATAAPDTTPAVVCSRGTCRSLGFHNNRRGI